MTVHRVAHALPFGSRLNDFPQLDDPPMWRSLALALVLMSALFVAPARSQMPAAPMAAPAGNAPPLVAEPDCAAPPVVWGVAILCTLVILFIVCTPTRKA